MNQNKQPGKYFLVNLALTDILKMLINIPMTLTSAFHQSWMFGYIGLYKQFIIYLKENKQRTKLVFSLSTEY